MKKSVSIIIFSCFIMIFILSGCSNNKKEIQKQSEILQTNYSYKKPIIPEGFHTVETETASWNKQDDGTVEGWNNGLVIEEDKGNQFVWVPVNTDDLDYYKEKSINKAEFKTFLQLLNPFAPHMTEELLHTVLGESNDFAYMDWPEYDESKTIANEITLPIQFNGKLKGTVQILLNEDETSVKEKVHNVVDSKLNGKNIIKEIYVKNKIYNIVVK